MCFFLFTQQFEITKNVWQLRTIFPLAKSEEIFIVGIWDFLEPPFVFNLNIKMISNVLFSTQKLFEKFKLCNEGDARKNNILTVP